MPYFPELPTWEKSVINTQQFLGLNRGLSIADGEMADMLNMSSDNFPVLSTRKRRGIPVLSGDGATDFPDGISGMLGTGKLIVCSGTKVYMDGKELPLTVSDAEDMKPKHMVSMGAYVCIWPDKVYFNIADATDYGDMGVNWTPGSGAEVTAMMCRRDGTNYDMETIPVGDSAPEQPVDKQFWMDTSGESDVLKQYSDMYKEWVQVATTFIKIQADGIGKKLKDFDVVHLSGVRAAESDADGDAKQLEALNTTNTIYGRGDNYIIVAGILRKATKLANTLKAEMKIPDLDYVCEANNRLWGCCYATTDGVITNEIRACALGDFRNWYKFSGTAADSYAMAVGSDGPFTGAYSLRGMPLIWKEDYLHKITGTMPSNFTLNTLRCRGVQNGSWRSLAVVNELLYYKSRTDVMAYDGAMPYAVGERLGQGRYYDATGGNYRDKYYLNMRDERDVWHVYVLDTVKGLWHKEDESHIPFMVNVDGDLVLGIDRDAATSLRTVGSDGGASEVYDWSVTFGVMGFQSEQQKYLSRYNIRAQMSAGSHMKVEMQYDSNGKWVHIGTMKSPQLRTFLLPIIPRRCDHCQLRISGTGTINIYSVAREYEQGGDG